MPPPPDSRAFALTGGGSQSPIRRSLSDRQLYRASSPGGPTPPSPPLGRATAAAPKPPTAKVAPLVGTPPSKSGRKALSSSSLKATDRTESGITSWDEQSEKERIQRLAGSLSHSVDSVVGSNSSDPKMSHDYLVISGDLLPGSVEKWKALVDTKDRIIAQKNHLIDR